MTFSDNAIIVLCTAPNAKQAKLLADKALNAKLAACVTILPNITSYYIWHGKRETVHEVQMILKSNNIHQNALIDLLKTEHPYEIPEILVLLVQYGGMEYLSWLNTSLR